MFSSDQRFLISGNTKENLKETLRFALMLAGSLINPKDRGVTGIGSFCIHPQYGFVFGNDYSDSDSEHFTKYPMPITLDMAVEHVMQYLGTREAQVIRDLQPREDGDGSVRAGWEVYLPDWAYFRQIVAIKPSWTFYAK